MENWHKRLEKIGLLLGVKEHIILLIFADFTFLFVLVSLSIMIYFHNICSLVGGRFQREYDYRLMAFLFLSDN